MQVMIKVEIRRWSRQYSSKTDTFSNREIRLILMFCYKSSKYPKYKVTKLGCGQQYALKKCMIQCQ